MTKIVRYFSAEAMTEDDFGEVFTLEPGELVYDAVTTCGSWATMTQSSFTIFGKGKIGDGPGQKYMRQANGQLHKIEG